MVRVFEFIRKNGVWYYNAPGNKKGKKTERLLIQVYKEGLHTLLNAVGKDTVRVNIHTSDEFFEGSDELELTQADQEGKGGYYLLKSLEGRPYVLLLRFFHVQDLFGYLPSRLYIRTEVTPR